MKLIKKKIFVMALALCLAAGLDGIRNRILPPEEATGNLYKLDITAAA